MMNDVNVHFINKNHIDSFQKLNFLLFLQTQPDLDATIQELAARSYLGYTALLEKIIADLQRVGLIDQTGNGYKLHREPGINASLKHLATTFANPVARQKLLAQVCG